MKNVKIFSLGIAMLITFLAFSVNQKNYNRPDVTITGVVSDPTGPLPGANVVVAGTINGTTTDINGKYSIVAKIGDKLEFSFVGLKTKTVKIGKSKVINVTLESATQIDEVVVAGSLGIRKRGDQQSSSTRMLKASEVTQGAAPQNYIGKVSGLQIEHDATKQSSRILIKGSNTNATDKTELKNRYKADDKISIVPSNISVESNTEDYDSFIENAFESPKNAPLSTFSIDVDNASYTNVRRFINNGQKVPKDAVRVEEMVNFFKYKYPQPTGEHPFSINTEYSACPWNTKHKLMKIGLQGKINELDNLPASNLVFLIDVSGSMNQQNRLPLVIQSMKILLNELRSEDKVSIVVYAGAAGLVLPPTSGSEKKKIADALEMLTAGGSTAGGAGIELAYKIAGENFIKGGNNRVILATDGDFNVGMSSNGDMESLITEKRKTGVFLTCLGYGMGNYKDSKLELLANKGNGNYAYIDNIQEANRFLGKEFKGSMFAIAKDVKIQIEFNPKEVQSYRLIGYENRKLRPEDFINDAIDAGELGSGHTVTALYEIIPQGVKSDFFAESTQLKYTQTKESGVNFTGELATVKFRYKKPDGEKSTEMIKVIPNKSIPLPEASEDLKFSAAVAWFGLTLRDSKLLSNKSTTDIKKLASQAMAYDTEGYKAEFIRLVEGMKAI